MARFTTEQTTSIAAIQHVINEWGNELDQHDGLELIESGVLTEDCRYNVGGEWREGRAAAATFYTERKARLDAQEGAPVMRHIISNVRVSFVDEAKAEAEFLLVYFAAVGTPPLTNYCDPIAVADVRMECRLDTDGEWRIARFDSGQIFAAGLVKRLPRNKMALDTDGYPWPPGGLNVGHQVAMDNRKRVRTFH